MTTCTPNVVCLSVIIVNFEIWKRDSGWPPGFPTLSACLPLWSTIGFEIVIRDDIHGLRMCVHVGRYHRIWNLKSWFGMTALVFGYVSMCVIIVKFDIVNLTSWFGMPNWTAIAVWMLVLTVKFEIWNRDWGWPSWSSGVPACLSSSSN